MTPEQHTFVEDMGQMMVGWGVLRNTGRIWAYLLLRSEPSSLDEIVAGLGIAKSGASVGTRQLVQLGLARGTGERGSRRLLYEALYDLEGILAARNSGTAALLQVMRQGAHVAPAGRGRDRLQGMADMVQAFVDMAPAILRQLREMNEKGERR
jgi:hypothetical protein